MHTGAISWLEHGSCVCTGDDPLANARGLSSRTDAHTILYLLRMKPKLSLYVPQLTSVILMSN